MATIAPPRDSPGSSKSSRHTRRTDSSLCKSHNASNDEQKHSASTPPLDILPTLRPYIETAEKAEQEVIDTIDEVITHYEELKAEKAEQEVIDTIDKEISRYQELKKTWQGRLKNDTSSMWNEQLLEDLSHADALKDARRALDETTKQARTANKKYRKALEEARKQEHDTN